MRCAYRPETWWSLGPDDKEPRWHSQLVPRVETTGGSHDHHGIRVNVKLLNLSSKTPGKPGVIFNSEFLYWLVAAKCPEIFRNQAVQAIVDYTWIHFVRVHYSIRILIRVLELVMLIYVVASPPTDEFLKRLTWSWAAATSMREISLEVTRAVGWKSLMGSEFFYTGNFWFFFNAGCIVSYAILVFSSIESMELVQAGSAHPELLCLVCSYRWAQLLVMLQIYRYRWIGYQLVPIIQAFFQISGILVIAVVAFFAFVHGFIALDAASTQEGAMSGWEIMVGTLRLFLLGDGTGVEMMSHLGTRFSGEGSIAQPFAMILMLLGIFFFCICILNIFIAVHGDAYVNAKERVVEDFYDARTLASLNSLLQATTHLFPRRWLPAWCRFRWRVNFVGHLPLGGLLPGYLVMVSPMFAIWFAWVWADFLHPLVPSVMLMLVMRMGDNHLLSELARGTGPWAAPLTRTLPTCPTSSTTVGPSIAKFSRTYPEEIAEETAHPHRYLWWATWASDDDELPGGLTQVADEVHCTKKNLERLIAALSAGSVPGSSGLLGAHVPGSFSQVRSPIAQSYMGSKASLDSGDTDFGQADFGMLGGGWRFGGLAADVASPAILAQRLDRAESKLSELQRDMHEVLERLPPAGVGRMASFT